MLRKGSYSIRSKQTSAQTLLIAGSIVSCSVGPTKSEKQLLHRVNCQDSRFPALARSVLGSVTGASWRVSAATFILSASDVLDATNCLRLSRALSVRVSSCALAVQMSAGTLTYARFARSPSSHSRPAFAPSASRPWFTPTASAATAAQRHCTSTRSARSAAMSSAGSVRTVTSSEVPRMRSDHCRSSGPCAWWCVSR
jgi:hypothetical protein